MNKTCLKDCDLRSIRTVDAPRMTCSVHLIGHIIVLNNITT